MTDQEALNAYVEKHPWVWQPGDHYKSAPWRVPKIVYDERQAAFFNRNPGLELKLPADSWIEGRLRKELGEHFGELLFDHDRQEFVCTYTFDKKSYEEAGWKSTPIQTLLAALEAVEEK